MRLIDRLRPTNPALAAKLTEQMGFITDVDLPAIVAFAPRTQLLVRCNIGRFLTAAESVKSFVDIITREGSDWVRDVSIPEPLTITG